MTARTQVGIVEWAVRIERARAAEMWLADALGAGVAEAADSVAKVDLVRRARLHAWHAELWKSVVPVFHTPPPEAAASSGVPAGTSPESVLEALDKDYGAWHGEVSVVAEAPIMRVLALVVRDHEDEVGP